MLSAFFSSAETAFTTVSHIRIRALIDEGNKRAIMVDKILKHKGKMLSAILIGNNIVNLSASALLTTAVIKIWGSYATGIATGIITVLVLIFGEISPKTAATIKADSIALFYAPIILSLMTVLTPLIIIVDFLAGSFLKLFKINLKSGRKAITEQELRTFVDVSHEDGVIETDEKRIINNLFDFGDDEAKDVMTPRIDMTAVSITSSYADIIKVFRESRYTRLPVFEENSDNIVGIINIKDLIIVPNKGSFNICSILRKPFFTYEHKNTSDLFKDMQRASQSLAIVLDEYGMTVGMITTEDLLEEIVGEIHDEYDTDETDPITSLSENTYRINALCKLDDINDEFKLGLESEDNDSIGGYIIEKLDCFPKRGAKLTVDGALFIVEHASKSRIYSIILKLDPKEAD